MVQNQQRVGVVLVEAGKPLQGSLRASQALLLVVGLGDLSMTGVPEQKELDND